MAKVCDICEKIVGRMVIFTNATENGDTSSAGQNFAAVPNIGYTAKENKQKDKYNMPCT